MLRCAVQTVKDKENMTFMFSSDNSLWLNRNTAITVQVENQTVSPDQLMTIRVEPRLKYGKFRGRRRLKTGAGIIKSRLASRGNPMKGNMAHGLRIEQRVRVNKDFKLIGNAVMLKAKAGASDEVGRAKSLEAIFKPEGSIEGRELMVGWNSMQVSRVAHNGRKLGETSTVHGGTLACQQHWGRETTVSGRMTMNSQGQSTLTVHVTSMDKMNLRWSFLVPVFGWIWDKITRRGAEEF
jgi:hypothetical protein